LGSLISTGTEKTILDNGDKLPIYDSIANSTKETTFLDLKNSIGNATTTNKGLIQFATTGIQDATKVPKATGVEMAALLTTGGYSLAPTIGQATFDNIADGSNYARVQKIYADAINAGTYNLLYDGIAWNESNDTYTRLGRTAASPNYLEVQNGMRRCVLKTDGTVNYYLYPTNSALKADGVTASNLTGVDGQVMVEIPKFYYKYEYIGTTHYWRISSLPLPGFQLHWLFKKDGVDISDRFAYIGAFEGVFYDTSAGIYVGGNGVDGKAMTFTAASKSITCTALTAPFENFVVGEKITVSGTTSNNGSFTVATVSAQILTVNESIVDESASSATVDVQRDYTITTGDKLGSVVGYSPISYLKRSDARKIAANIGSNFFQEDFAMASAVQLLYLIEFGSFNSQNKIGAGITNVTDWVTYNNYCSLAKTGNSVSLGNGTGNTAGSTSSATEKTKYVSYRGIENPFGHIWKWIDGININNNAVYICNNPTNFADDTTTNYTQIGTISNIAGYQKTLLQTLYGFLPLTVGSPADSSHYITDYYSQDVGWRIVEFGGRANTGANAGLFQLACSDPSTSNNRGLGARLCYKK